MIRPILTAVAVVGMAIASFASTARAEFPEKDITFIIPFGPGGGFDTTARAIAQVLPKYLPNNVNVVPKNVPGAGGKKGYGELARSAPDGYTIAIINYPGAALPAILGEEASYDINTLTWLGRLSVEEYVLVTNSATGMKSLEDVKAHGGGLKFTSTGAGTATQVAIAITRSVLGIDANILTGYKSSAEFILGVIRGDGEVAMPPVDTARKYIESGDLVPIVTFQEVSTLKDVPTIKEAGYAELSGLGVERYVAGPPGMPEDIQKVLSDALLKAIADPETQAWAETTKRPFSPLDAAASDKAVKASVQTMLKYKDALK